MSSEPSEYVVEKAREALASDPRVGEIGMTVHVVGSDVYVEGIVATEERRGAIEEILDRLLPDHRIHNRVGVEEIHEPAAPENLP